MYLKKTELEQALRENMQSTLESYGGDSIAEDAINQTPDHGVGQAIGADG